MPIALFRSRSLPSRAPACLATSVSRSLASLPSPKRALEPQINHISDMGSERLYMLSKMEGEAQIPATRERMRREIMRVDGVAYADATPMLLEVNSVRHPPPPFTAVPHK